MSAFTDQLTTDAANIVFNADEFSETITWHPLDGPERSISAVITLDESLQRDERTENVEITGTAIVGRVETTAAGGVAAPRPGEWFRRSGEAPDVRYAFTGEIVSVQPDTHVLRFKRREPYRRGVKSVAEA